MIRARLALLAEGLSMDQRQNSATAYNIFDEVQALAFPIVIPRLFFYANFERDLAVDPANFVGDALLDLDGQVLLGGPVQLDFQTRAIARFAVAFQGILIPHPGTLRVRVMHDQVMVAECSTPIILQPQQAQQLNLPTLPTPQTPGGPGGQGI